jgi:hypothetical protein
MDGEPSRLIKPDGSDLQANWRMALRSVNPQRFPDPLNGRCTFRFTEAAACCWVGLLSKLNRETI